MKNSLILQPQAESAPPRILPLDNLQNPNNNQAREAITDLKPRRLQRRPSGSFVEHNDLCNVPNHSIKLTRPLGSPRQVLGSADTSLECKMEQTANVGVRDNEG